MLRWFHGRMDAYGRKTALMGMAGLAMLGCGESDEPAKRSRVGSSPSELLTSTFEAKLAPSLAVPNGHFGSSVAISKDTVAVGVPFEDTVRVFVRTGGTWASEATLTATSLGNSVALDGDTILSNGVVYVRSAGTWTQQAQIGGQCVALQGDTAVTGSDTSAGTGRAWVSTRSGGTWTTTELVPTGIAIGSGFGSSVAVSGNTALVGAHFHASTGAAFVFVKSGASWTQQAMLKPSGLAGGSFFGSSVAMDGDTAVVSAPSQGSPPNGFFYVFVRSGTTWTLQQTVGLPVSGDGWLGWGPQGVALRSNSLLIGEGGDGAGSAYLYERGGTTWTQQAKLKPPDGSTDDQFGDAVAIGDDSLIVGSPLDENGATNSGSAYVFSLKASDGYGCTVSTGCISGFCVDGVCCDTECGGTSQLDCQACSVAAGALSNGVCSVLASTAVCRPAVGACDVVELCDGVGATCPADIAASAGAGCDDGDACTGLDVCDGSGVCAGSALTCDDQNECTDDSCQPGSGCSSVPKPLYTPCSIGLCIAGACLPVVRTDAGPQGGSGGTGASSGTSGTGATGGVDGGSNSGGAGQGNGGTVTGATGGTAPSASSDDSGGCGCRTAGSTQTAYEWITLIALLVRRRRPEKVAR
jgi:hypothetical protein